MAVMAVADAIEVLAQILNTVTNAVAQASQISTIVKGAQQQGRNTLTEDEWTIVNQANSQSRQALVDAINQAFANAGLATKVL